MRKPPRCPDCGARAIFCDPAGLLWQCPKCKPEGKTFEVDPDSAREYSAAYREELGELEGVVRRHYTPIPTRNR